MQWNDDANQASRDYWTVVPVGAGVDLLRVRLPWMANERQHGGKDSDNIDIVG